MRHYLGVSKTIGIGKLHNGRKVIHSIGMSGKEMMVRFKHVERISDEKLVKKIYEIKVSVMRGKRRKKEGLTGEHV